MSVKVGHLLWGCLSLIYGAQIESSDLLPLPRIAQALSMLLRYLNGKTQQLENKKIFYSIYQHGLDRLPNLLEKLGKLLGQNEAFDDFLLDFFAQKHFLPFDARPFKYYTRIFLIVHLR